MVIEYPEKNLFLATERTNKAEIEDAGFLTSSLLAPTLLKQKPIIPY